ncbi:MAG TPA: hypothetical protein VGT07_11780 [Steroidobacteraceae bacterium]|nr:hypothetical protein [Steroidobacteraceae bacterium]
MHTLSKPKVAMLALAVMAAVGGCGTRVGSQSQGGGVTPDAVITMIGQEPTSSAGANPMTVTVRSGADVVMSGKDSDGRGVALQSFQWSQTGGPPLPSLPDPGALLYTTANTVDFRAPDVASPTTLTFQLKVTNANSVSGTADLNVTVVPGLDPDEFLAPPTVPHRFTVAVTTSQGLSGLAADVPVCVSVARQIQYTDRAGNAQTVSLPQDTSLEADATWSAALGGEAAISGGSTNLQNAVDSYTNPRVVFEIPALNDQYLVARFDQPVAGDTTAQLDALMAQQLVTADEDSASLGLAITATPGSCDGTLTAPELGGENLIVAVLDASGKVALESPPAAAGAPAVLTADAGGAPLTADGLLGALTPAHSSAQIQTTASADAYYQAIDPLNIKTTLQGWLQANCFDPNATDYGVAEAGADGAHAVYTNNYDLGFGRDMYVIKCAADHTDSATGTVTAHQGDLAAIVFNYPSLELAVLRQDPINGVAMEWSAAADGSNPTHRFTKFYVFGPDDRTGTFKRIAGANFDHRGVKVVPGTCTVCHGGSLASLPAGFSAGSTYPVVQDPTSSTACSSGSSAGCLSPGDVDAAFLPWDIASLLFSDNDPSFKGNVVSGASATMTAEQPAIKQLNTFVYQTYQPELESVGGTTVDRYAAGRELIEQWYGGPGLPSATYSDSGTPAGWSGSSTATSVYHDVFARNCRACHTENPNPSVQFSGFGILTDDGYQSLLNEFSATGLGRRYVFQETLMPDSRLTTDRFWVNEQGGTSAATTLATAVQQATSETDLLGSDQNAIPTGQPVVGFTVNGTPADPTTGKFAAARFSGARVDSSASYFIAKYEWSLCLIRTSGSTCASQPLDGDTTADPGFDTSQYGDYQLTLVATNDVGQSATQTYEIDVANTVPEPSQVSNCPSGLSAPYSSSSPGSAITVNISSCFTSFGDPPYTLQVSSDGTSYGSAVTGSSVPWNATVVPGTPQLNSNGRNTTVPTISFNFNPSAAGNATVYYELCDTDNICATGNAAIAPAGSLSVNPASLVAYWSPSAFNPSNSTSGTIAIPPSAVAINAGPAMSLGSLQSDVTLNVPSSLTVNLAFGALASGTGSLSSSSLSGNPSSLDSQIGTLTYAPPSAFVTCDLNGDDLSTGTGTCTNSVSFTDTLSASGYANSGSTVSIDVQALTSFSRSDHRAPSQLNIYSGVLATCNSSGCHASGGGGGTAIWSYDSGSEGNTYTSIIDAVGSGSTNVVVPGSPNASQFYLAPCTSTDTAAQGLGMYQVFTTNSAQCQILFQWILEGAPND